jgi:glyoxylase-like metal-dependent hydrolase (beta-lactamase superfamily II)
MLRTLAVVLLTWLALGGSGLRAAPSYAMHAEQVALGVYAVITPSRALPNPQNRGWNSNSAFVVTGDGVLLFDSGSSTAIGEALKRTIAGVTDQPVRWIVNSHAHGDHWLGNAAFRDSVEKVIASTPVGDSIESEGGTWVALFDRMTEGATGHSEIVPPDTRIDRRSEFALGGTRLEVFPSGNSHSPGDLLLWLPDARVLISGDVVYSDRMPSTNNADVAQWIRQLGELQALRPRVVIPGHGAVTDAAGLARLQAMLQAFWQAVARGYEAGKSDYEMTDDVIRALASFEPHYPGLADKVRRDISHVYLQVEAAAF